MCGVGWQIYEAAVKPKINDFMGSVFTSFFGWTDRTVVGRMRWTNGRKKLT